MKSPENDTRTLLDYAGLNAETLHDREAAHVVIHENRVLGSNTVPGLFIEASTLENGVRASIRVEKNRVIEKPVHLCFGVVPETGTQRIVMEAHMEENSRAAILAHCVFPFAVDVRHIMEGTIHISKGAHYSYHERHVHSPEGGVKVYPKAVVTVEEGGTFTTEFELLKGRVGLIDIDYEVSCARDAVMEMVARVSGTGDDIIRIHETGHLTGERARGVLRSKIAVRDDAQAEIYSKMTASAPFARGHVDCKEIVQDRARATAVPVVEVNHPRAHITHEAAIGSVDSKQLETLMARGLNEDEAVELIIGGLLG